MKDQWGAKNAMYRHGMFGTRAHKIWDGMIQRCCNPNSRDYKHWGARGITVDHRWREFVHFYRDMGEPPEGKTLGRIDNSKGYSKENCRWETWKEQQRNRRSNRLITFRGRTEPLAHWIEESGLNKATFDWRFRNGWKMERIFSTKPIKGGKCGGSVRDLPFV